MKVDAPATLNDQTEKEDIFLQVLNTEKLFLTSIHSKGLLHKDSQELYRKVRAGYESIILNNHDVIDLHEVEYFLWKLHYKHIDEFRKRIRQCSFNSENKNAEAVKDDTDAESTIKRHIDGFKSFLSEATEFYKNLIKKFRESCGLPGEFVPFNKAGSSISVEATKLKKCHYLCHRFLICLGDLARYSELYKKQDAQNWSVAFAYYLKATRVCPVSGNPHNQLALLGTYVGDAFLALYHCIRSLAVKDPFPDACNNLLLLFEENRSSHLQSLSYKAHLDISKPSEIISLCSASHAGTVSSHNDSLDITNNDSAGKTELWPLLVRWTSFFLVGCSLEDFPCILSLAVKHLQAVMALEDEQLSAALESYNLMDSTRRGPYRAVQLVSVLIFILFNETTDIQGEKLNLTNNEQLSAPTELAVVATFICMGHLLGRCLKGNQADHCPLLPAVLVFMEWLIGAFERVRVYSADEKVMIAMSYFFDALSNFLNRLGLCKDEITLDNNALWEDHELRGFEPISYAHSSLDFTTDQEWTNNTSSMNRRRYRIFHVGMKLANRSSDNRQWIFFDERENIFKSTSWMEILHKGDIVGAATSSFQVKKPQELESRTVGFREKDSAGEIQLQHSRHGQSVAMEEEEVIVFKPILRYNSEPVSKYIGTDHISANGLKEQIVPADESLRRATSMFTWENQAQTDGPSFLSDGVNARYNKPFKQQEPLFKDSVACPTGPPSLSAWVFDREGSNFEAEKGIHDFEKCDLSPIPELATERFSGLSINETRGPLIDSLPVSAAPRNLPPTYVAPVPSAPLLPDDASWFRGNSSTFQDYRNAVGSREPDGILGAPPLSGYSNAPATRGPLDFGHVLPGLVHGYPPLLGMSSAEWLYHYRNNHKLEQTDSPIWPVHLNGPGPLSSLHTNDISRFDLLSPWGNNLISTPALYMESPQLHPGSPLVYVADEQSRENLLSGYQRSSPYVCGAGTETRPEQQPLLQYLKQKEWYLQREPQLRGASAFMGN